LKRNYVSGTSLVLKYTFEFIWMYEKNSRNTMYIELCRIIYAWVMMRSWHIDTTLEAVLYKRFTSIVQLPTYIFSITNHNCINSVNNIITRWQKALPLSIKKLPTPIVRVISITKCQNRTVIDDNVWSVIT